MPPKARELAAGEYEIAVDAEWSHPLTDKEVARVMNLIRELLIFRMRAIDVKVQVRGQRGR